MRYDVGDVVRLKWRLCEVYRVVAVISDDIIGVVPVGYDCGLELVRASKVKKKVGVIKD